MKQTKLFLSLSLLLFVNQMQAQWSVLDSVTITNPKWYLFQKFTPQQWEAGNFASAEDMQWFNEARYGMFIHFGLSTYVGKELSWGICTAKAPDGGRGAYPDSVWTKWTEHFKMENFDADEWVRIAQRAGMKYIVTIAKHHDGFHMWDTQCSDFKITNTPFGRDYLKEIADACHKAGMKFGIYYSQRDWYHPDYAPVDTALVDRIGRPPFYKAKPGKEARAGARHQKYIDYQFKAVKELCTNYGKVDVFWFDACWWGGMFTAEMWESEKLTRMIRQLQPGIIINNRASIPGDFDTPEQKVGMYQARPWESCMSLCRTWSWSDTPVKSAHDLVHTLSATASGNGNMLLSWGPKWDGAYDPAQIQSLEQVGHWLKKYGRTVYNTKGGPWYPGDWGGSTYKGKTAWLHLSKGCTDILELPAVKNKITAARCLTGGEVSFSQNKQGLVIDLANAKQGEYSALIELTFEDEITRMVDEKSIRSIFSDPVYGHIISANALVKVSSAGKKDKPHDHQKLLSTGSLSQAYSFYTKKEKQANVIIDLGENYTVTGVKIKKATDSKGGEGEYVIQISEDGVDWQDKERKQGDFELWEASVANFSAGIQLPGAKARYVRISLSANKKMPLHLQQVHVYGKK